MMSKTLPRFKSSTGLAYSKIGAGQPIVLIHGVGLRAESWLEQMTDLSRTNTVYAVDMPGHGESDLQPKLTCLEEYVDWLANWITDDIQQAVIVMGHSMGSMMALNFSFRYPHLCKGVVALNSVYRRSAEAKRSVQNRALEMQNGQGGEKIIGPIKRWFDTPPKANEKEIAELCRQWLLNAPIEGYTRAYQIFSDNDGPNDKDLKQLALPALFITGRGDLNSSAEMSQQMAQLCPIGTSHVIEGAKHMAQMTHATTINPLMLQFVEQCQAY